MSTLDLKESTIADLCMRYGVLRLALFSSAANDDFDPETSDVDFLVEFDDAVGSGFDAPLGLKEALEEPLDRSVDLVMPSRSRTRTSCLWWGEPAESSMQPECAAFIWDVCRGTHAG